MKKIITLFVSLSLILLLSACNSKEKPSNENTFIGTIEKIEEKTAIVSIEEGDILKSGDRAKVYLSANKNEVFFVGDKVEVTYDGNVRESYPLSINTISVKKAK